MAVAGVGSRSGPAAAAPAAVAASMPALRREVGGGGRGGGLVRVCALVCVCVSVCVMSHVHLGVRVSVFCRACRQWVSVCVVRVSAWRHICVYVLFCFVCVLVHDQPIRCPTRGRVAWNGSSLACSIRRQSTIVPAHGLSNLPTNIAHVSRASGGHRDFP